MQPIEQREHVQRLFYYDRWANGQVFDMLMKMDDVPQKDIDRMGHVVAALMLWSARLTGKGNPDIALFNPGWSLVDGKARLESAHDAWASYLGACNDDDLMKTIEWERYEGGKYKALLRDIVTQLPMHGAYHRGQISITLKDKLPAPLDLDYIFTTWEPAG